MRKLLLLFLLVIIIGQIRTNGQSYIAGSALSEYTDIDPDTLMSYTIVPFSNNIYSFDILGDTMPELEFTSRGSVSSGGTQAFIRVRSLDPGFSFRFGRWDSVYVPGTSSWYVTKVAEPLDSGMVINTLSADWDTSEMYLTDHTSSGGGAKDVNDWIGTDKYLAFRYSDIQTENYGWMRIECPSADSCYVKDFSFAQAPIGFVGSMHKKFKVYPNPSRDVINVEGENILSFEVIDLTGKVLIRERSARVLSVVDLKAGTYFLKVINGDGVEVVSFVRD